MDYDVDGVLAAPLFGSVLDDARTGASASIVENRVYLIGGQGAVLNASFQWASLMSNTTGLGTPIVVSGVTVPSTRIDYCMVVSGQHVYLFGGRNVTTAIESATVAPDGTVSTFTNETAVLSGNQHSYCGSIVAGKFAYVIGGSYAASNNNTYERIPLNDDGTIGTPDAPAMAGSHAPNTGGFGITSAATSVFTFGGEYYDTATSTTKIYQGYGYDYLQSPDGPISQTYAQPTGIGAASPFIRSCTFGRDTHLIGGSAVGTSYFPIMSNGTLAANAAGPSLGIVRNQPSLAYVGSRLYVLGGFNSSVAQNTYDYLGVNAAGTLAAGSTSAAGFFGASGFSNNHATVLGNNLYLFAGVEATVGSSKVLRIPVL